MDILQLYQRFCPEQKPGCIAACEGLDRLFSPLYEVPSHLLIPYCKLKTMELLLYLSSAQPCASNGGECARAYSAQQTATIRQIHDLLVNNLQQRFTIDELSRRYLVNTSFLKAAFKTVYGQPIASYMKEYRTKKRWSCCAPPMTASLRLQPALDMKHRESSPKPLRMLPYSCPPNTAKSIGTTDRRKRV